jgi:hypothetical protein
MTKERKASDDIAHDMEILAMWERGEHTCHMFNACCAVCVYVMWNQGEHTCHMFDTCCAVCEKDQERGEQEEEVQRFLITKRF